MNCRCIEELIPLFVGDDLDNDERVLVASHAAKCASCRVSIEQYEESRDWLQSVEVPELDDAMLAGFRRDIVARLDVRPQRFVFPLRINLMQGVFAALLLLVIVAGLIYLQRSGPESQNSPFAQIEPDQTPPSKSDGNMVVLEEHSGMHGELHRTIRKRSHRVKEQDLISRSAPGEMPEIRTASRAAVPVRIEIQTADPNIRIIWFSSASAELSKSFSEE